MTIRTEDVQAGVSLVERPDGPWPHPPGLPATAEAYWRSLYERERTRAEAAEARCEELRWKEVASRARAGSLKWCLDNCRRKLAARVGKLKEVRRAAKKDVQALEVEVARLEKQLRKAGVEPGKRSPLESLRKEVARLDKALSGALPPGEAARLHRVVEKREKTIESLREEIEGREKDVARLENRLAWEKLETKTHEKTIQCRDEEVIRLCGKLRELRDDLRVSLRAAARVKEGLKERLLRAKEAARSRSPRSDEALRKALGRSRRQKTALRSLSRENGRLRRELRKSETRRARLEAELAKLRATGAVLARRLFGRGSERQERPRSERRRGRQPGAARPWPHPAARARGEDRNPQPAGRCARLRRLRAALCGERRRGLHHHRDRSLGLQARHPPSEVAQEVRVRVVSGGSVGAPRAAPVRAARPSEPACGRASCSNATPASAPCGVSPNGSPTRGFRSRRARWPPARTA